MNTRKHIDSEAMGLMLMLSLIWGLQQVSLKAIAADIAPIMMIALRSGLSALLVGILMLVKREPLALQDGTWRPGMLVGVLFALEFLLLAEGLRHTSAAHSVVFLYTAPIFAAIGLHRKLPAERLHPLQWFGIALAFTGIAVAFLWRSHGADLGGAATRDTLWGDFLGLLAGIAWGATTVTVRTTRLSSAPATKTLMYQLVGAFSILLLAAFFSGQARFTPTPLVWGMLVFHAVIVSFASYLIWFWMLKRYLASQLGVFSFMTPLFGVAFGAWLLREPLEPAFMGGAVLVLCGIVLVNVGKRKAFHCA